MNRCPICGYDGLSEPAWDGENPSHEICPSCGIEFGYEDMKPPRHLRHLELREAWIQRGMPWFSKSRPPPPAWDPSQQLQNVRD